MQRMVREARAKQAAEAALNPQPAKPRRVRMTAADRERARNPQVHRNRVAVEATSVVLVGPQLWRQAVDESLAGMDNLAVAADVEGDPHEVDIFKIPQADVVLIAVDGQRPNYAIEFAMRLQGKDRGTGIALVLPRMTNRNLRTFHTYAGSWSLISASVCSDRDRLSAVLESAGRGIPWVDPIITRLLASFEHGTADFDQDYEESSVSEYVVNNDHRTAEERRQEPPPQNPVA